MFVICYNYCPAVVLRELLEAKNVATLHIRSQGVHTSTKLDSVILSRYRFQILTKPVKLKHKVRIIITILTRQYEQQKGAKTRLH